MSKKPRGSVARRKFATKVAEIGYRRVFTHAELATRWRISRAQLFRLREKGFVPFFTPPDGKKHFYPLDDILALERTLSKGRNSH